MNWSSIPPAVDDPFVHVMPGESRLYEFTLPPGSAGTYWYFLASENARN